MTPEHGARLVRLGIMQGYRNVIRMLREEGVSLEVQDKVHELLDREELRNGNTKRQPRSAAVRAEREDES